MAFLNMSRMFHMKLNYKELVTSHINVCTCKPRPHKMFPTLIQFSYKVIYKIRGCIIKKEFRKVFKEKLKNLKKSINEKFWEFTCLLECLFLTSEDQWTWKPLQNQKINSNLFWQNKGTLYWCHKLVLGLQEGHRSLDNTRDLQKLAQHNLCKGASDDDNKCANPRDEWI
jgi:hypothetical protein